MLYICSCHLIFSESLAIPIKISFRKRFRIRIIVTLTKFVCLGLLTQFCQYNGSWNTVIQKKKQVILAIFVWKLQCNMASFFTCSILWYCFIMSVFFINFTLFKFAFEFGIFVLLFFLLLTMMLMNQRYVIKKN